MKKHITSIGIILGILVLAILVKFVDIVGPIPIKLVAWMFVAWTMIKFLRFVHEQREYFVDEIVKTDEKWTRRLLELSVLSTAIIIQVLLIVILLY